jgi:type VI secretion system protein ImpC
MSAVMGGADTATLLDRVVADSARAQDEMARLIEGLVDNLTASSGVHLLAAIDARLAGIDCLISAQLSAVLHAPALQQLESTWTGLHYLVSRGEPEHNVVVRILNASKKELARDFQSAVEFDHSTLFRRVYEEEFGTFGGAPFGVLLGDYEINRQPGDLYLLEQVAHVAAAAHAPFVTGAAPGLFGLESFADLAMPRELAKLFDTADYARWKAFRQSEDARYVGLTLPRFLGRLPYRPANGNAARGFQFVEDVDGEDASGYLWCSAAYAFGARLSQAFADFGWCAAIRGIDGGGLVDDLPVDSFHLSAIAPKCSTDVVITDRREKELSDLGFIALVHCKNTSVAAFFGAQSAQRAKKYDSDAANANAVLSSQLQYIFAVSRIAHYMKVMMRDKIGSFVSASEVEDFLNRWVTRYVLLDDDATQEQKAQFPLREASVHVSPVPGRAGVYRAVAFLRPHFQLDELSVSLRLVAELPAASA